MLMLRITWKLHGNTKKIRKSQFVINNIWSDMKMPCFLDIWWLFQYSYYRYIYSRNCYRQDMAKSPLSVKLAMCINNFLNHNSLHIYSDWINITSWKKQHLTELKTNWMQDHLYTMFCLGLYCHLSIFIKTSSKNILT